MASKKIQTENRSAQVSPGGQKQESFEGLEAIETVLQAGPPRFMFFSAVKIFFYTLISLYAVAFAAIGIGIWLLQAGQAPAWLAVLFAR